MVEAGSGSLPTEKIPSIAIIIRGENIKAQEIYNKLLNARVPVIGYISNNLYHIDLKAIPEDEIKNLISSLKECLK